MINKLTKGVLFVILLGYIVARAVLLSFTHDESISFDIVEGNDFFRDTANHHLLNTLLMSWSAKLFGNSEFALRLPNVLAFVVYFFSLAAVVKLIKDRSLVLLGLILGLGSPFLMEFFSLARGYGISLGFFVLSLLYLLKNNAANFTYREYGKNYFYCLWFGVLSMFANLSMINYLIMLVALFAFQLVLALVQRKEDARNFVLIFTAITISAAVPFYIAIKQLLFLKERGELYFGADSFADLVNSVIAPSNGYTDATIVVFSICFLASMAVGTIAVIYKKDYKSPLFILILMITGLAVGFRLENLIFSAKYPHGRGALFLLVLVVLYIIFFIAYIFESSSINSSIKKGLVFCVGGALIINFLSLANLQYTTTWRYDAHTKDAMKIIETTTKDAAQRYIISNDWLLEPAINYYIRTRGLKLAPTDRSGVKADSHFIYKLNTGLSTNFTLLKSYDDIQSSLWIHKELLK